MAGLRAGLVHRAQIPFEKDASIFVALKDAAFLRALIRVVPYKLVKLKTKEAAKVFNIAIGNLRCRHLATVCTRCAIDFVLNVLGDCLEPAFNEVVALQPGAETRIFLTILLPVAFDLYEVRYHPFIISRIFRPEQSRSTLFYTEGFTR